MNASVELVGDNTGIREKENLAKAVVCAVLMPHAPVLVPAVGGDCEAVASRQAMRAAAGKVISLNPETVVVISPHSPRKSGAFGLWADDPIAGSFEQFGAPQARVSLPNDRRLANAIAAKAHACNLHTWFIRSRLLDHGALVPLWFLAEAGWTGPTVLLSLNHPGEGGLTSLGEAIAGAAKVLHRRIAVIASGDMSHCLTANAPCGFHPEAHRFDETFIRLVRAGDYRKILGLNPDLRELAAEDVVDSVTIAAAAVAWNPAGRRVLNYEGPLGVGYGVAILFAAESTLQASEKDQMASADVGGKMLPEIARRSVEAALRGSAEAAPVATGDYLCAPHGVFVTIRHQGGKLRGCIGTLAPVCHDLMAETWRNARLAAFQDARFSPVTTEELADLLFHVSVIHSPEEIFSPAELDPRRFGVIVSTADGRRGLLLPGIGEITTVEQQLRLARRKGWIDPDEPVKLERFQADHFEEAA